MASQQPEQPEILAPISLGELIDKITILTIKTNKLCGQAQKNSTKELEALQTTLSQLNLTIEPALIQALQAINQQLWEIEDQIREHERAQNFGPSFIKLARSVYQHNDRRAAIKRDINIRYHSNLIEEKSYQPYA